MTPKIAKNLHSMTDFFIHWTDPYWWIFLSLALFILSMIHFKPLSLPEDNVKTKDHIFLFLRRVTIAAFVALVLIYPLLAYFSLRRVSYAEPSVTNQVFSDWWTSMLGSYWTLPITGIFFGTLANFCWHRYGEPYLSNLKRNLRVSQHTDELSDVKTAGDHLKAKDYDPEQYFKDGYVFVGLDEKNKPILIPYQAYVETHKTAFGPTGNGKGVLLGVLVTQMVRYGHCVAIADPKGDAFLPYICQNEAKKAGVPFVFLDLTGDTKGAWHPFKGGSERDRRARMIAAFGLEKGGTDADVYKSRERAMVDRLLKETDGTIKQMLDYLEKQKSDKEELSSLADGLREWSQIPTFVPSKRKEGHSVEKSLMNRAVIYIKGSLSDPVIKEAMKCYVTELLQESKRLAATRSSHASLFFDELRFYMCPEIVDGLASIRSSNVDMTLSTQSTADLKNIRDKSIDAQSLQTSFLVNCQIKYFYAAGDMETAEFAESYSGTTNKRVLMQEKLETNRLGGEKWSNQRSLTVTPVPLIDRNMLLRLPKRVAIIFRPGSYAEPVFTAWMKTDTSMASWMKQDAEEAKIPPKEIKPDTPNYELDLKLN